MKCCASPEEQLEVGKRMVENRQDPHPPLRDGA